MSLDLDAIKTEFLTQCGSCDAGLLMGCTCTQRDYRPTMAALVAEVERLREFAKFIAEGEDAADWLITMAHQAMDGESL